MNSSFGRNAGGRRPPVERRRRAPAAGRADGIRMTTPLDAARDYVRRGWRVVPVPYKAKGPMLRGWPDLHLTVEDLPKHFNGQPTNIGVITGPPVDLDIDAMEAVRLADAFLPRTPCVFGRAS